MFNLFKTKKKIVTVEKYRPVFMTVDGNLHAGLEYKYGITNRLRCSIPEYIMIDITRDEYIQDNCNVMYPLANVVSIDWQLVDTKEIEDKFGEYTIFVSAEAVKQHMVKEV